MTAPLHARLPASGAHRWMACPASPAMEARFRDKNSRPETRNDTGNDPEGPSEDAPESAEVRELAEQCLRGGVNADAYLGEKLCGTPIDARMIAAVQTYLDHVRSLPGRRFVAQRVDFGPFVPGSFGTADVIVLRDGVATVIGLKTGKGARIAAKNNPQAMLYGLGALNDFRFLYEIENLQLVIVQPMLDHVSVWKISRSALETWAEKDVKPAATAALSPDPAFAPGESQCRGCKARFACRAFADFRPETANTAPKDLGGTPTPHEASRNGFLAA